MNNKKYQPLIFFCSDLGKLCIKSLDFTEKSTLFEILWKRYDSNHYNKWMNLKMDTSPSSCPDKVNEIKKIIEPQKINQSVNSFIQKTSTTSQQPSNNHEQKQQFEQNYENVIKEAQKEFKEFVPDISYEETMEIVQTETGKLLESSTIELYRNEMFDIHEIDFDFQTKSIPFFKRKIIDEFSSPELIQTKHFWKSDIYLGGRPDAIRKIDGIPLEAKSRVKKLFQEIPNYEFYQCQGYCFILNKPQCIWVQRYQTLIDHEIIEKNQSVLEKIFATLIRYADLLALILLDDDYTKFYAQTLQTSKQRSKFVKEFVFSESTKLPEPKIFI